MKRQFIEATVNNADGDAESKMDEQQLQIKRLKKKNPELATSTMRVMCPYLDTINRQLLDFDSEKLCSVTLTNMNVYACLVCGKFFQGRGKSTPAFTHSVQAGHFVFMNLQSGRTYCLPDDYEVRDTSLRDIMRCLSPTFDVRELYGLNSSSSLVRDVHGISYLPGFVGLNNLHATDDLNCVLHALAHVTPFRDFWLQSDEHWTTALSKSRVVKHFGLAMRKIWSAHNFKSTVSPQELVQEIVLESKRRFSIGSRSECCELLVWLLGVLSKGLSSHSPGTVAAYAATARHHPAAAAPASALGNGSAQIRSAFLTDSSPVYEPFQGIVEVTSLTKRLVSSIEEKQLVEKLQAAERGEEKAAAERQQEWVRSVSCAPFNFLSLEIPPCPLFRDSEGGMVIPQVPLFELLKKFDGQTWTDQVTKEAHVRRCYRILKLPRYLVLHLIRFTRNNFYMEKNPTIVTFPVKNFETKGLLYAAPSVRSDDEAVDAISSRGGGGKAMGKTKLNSVQRAAAELRHCDELRERCPPLGSVNNFSSEQLQDFIASFGAQLHQSQMSLLLKQSEGVARGSSIESKAPDVVSSGDAGTDMNGNRSGDESDVVRLQLLLIAKDAHKRVQLMRRCGGDDDAATVVSGSKYDLVANICHDTTSGVGQGGVAVGDLNMFAAGATAAAGGGKSKTASTASSTTASSTGSAVCNDSVLNDGAFKVHVQHKATGQWFEIQDLRVAEVSPQLIGVSESNILIYEMKS